MDQKVNVLEQIQLFVLDLDGTFYLGDQIFDDSLEFLNRVVESRRDYIFFTNNSSKSCEVYIEKLRNMGCFIHKDQIMTSGDVTIEYLQTYYADKRVYLVGTKALEESFQAANIKLTQDMPDIVVVSFDTTLTYKKLERACTYIRDGAMFLATHMDINCPIMEGFIPDCGAFCAAITKSTGVKPKYLGKPFSETVDMILKRTKRKASEVAFVGDRLYTDVATGVKNGATGLLVLTGETKLSDLKDSEIVPDAVYQSIGEIGECLLRCKKV